MLGLIEGGNPGVGTCKKRKDYCGIEEGLLYRGVEALSILSSCCCCCGGGGLCTTQASRHLLL